MCAASCCKTVPGGNEVCFSCVNTDQALRRHGAADPQIDKGFKRKSAEEKLEFFQAQKRLREEAAGSIAYRYSFDSLQGTQSVVQQTFL